MNSIISTSTCSLHSVKDLTICESGYQSRRGSRLGLEN